MNFNVFLYIIWIIYIHTLYEFICLKLWITITDYFSQLIFCLLSFLFLLKKYNCLPFMKEIMWNILNKMLCHMCLQ